MGRQKGDANRSNNRPSSSSTAASLLENSNTSSVGFGGYIGSSRIEMSDAQEKDFHGDMDGEAALHFRRLSKKDPTTRIKAVRALVIIFKERPASELCQLLPNWIFEYKRLVQDDNQQVREGAHNAMGTLADAVGRDLAPHLRSVMGAWWISQFDLWREVSAAAQQSFQVAFQGPLKRMEALMFCASDVLTYVDELLKLSPQTIAEKSTPIEEATTKYELVISSALLALADFLDIILLKKNLSSSVIGSIENGDITILRKRTEQKRNEIEEMAVKVCLNHKFFQNYAKSKSSQIRSSSYKIIRSFAQNVPAVFSGRDLEAVGGIVFGSFSDKDQSCHPAMWDMVLVVSQQYPQAWDTVSFRKFVLPRLWAFLRHATYGSAGISYPCILPLLCMIPTKIIKPAIGFYKELFLNLWEGHNNCHMAMEDEIALLKAIQECFLWAVTNAVRYAEKEDISPDQINHFMIENVLLKILWNNYAFAGMPLPNCVSPGSSVNQKINHPVREIHGNTFHYTFSEQNSAGDSGFIREKFSKQFIENLRRCITDLLAAIAVKSSVLICVFWNLFQDVCVRTVIYEAEHSLQSSPEGYGCISRISTFLSHFGQLSLSNGKQKQWLLMQGVRPLVAKLYPVAMSMENKEVIQLLATIVSIFGPSSFAVLQVPDSTQRKGLQDEIEEGDCENEETLVLGLSSFIRDELIPWCLDGNDASYTEKIELLLSFFEDERLRRDWDSVLAYATQLEADFKGIVSVKVEKVSVLATLVQKFRLHFIDSCKGCDFRKGESESLKEWNMSRLDEAALAVAGSLALSHSLSLQLLRDLLGGFDKDFSPPLISKRTAELVIKVLLQRMLDILVRSESHWAQYAASSVLVPDARLPLVRAEEDKLSLDLANAAVQAICCSIFSIQYLDEESDVVPKVVASLYCINWNCSIVLKEELFHQDDVGLGNASDGESDESIMDSQFEFNSNAKNVEHVSSMDMSVVTSGSQHKTEAVSAMIKNIQSILSSGFCKRFLLATRFDVQRKLIQCVRYAILDESPQILGIASLCANWVRALIDQVCVDVEETAQLVDLLFEPAYAWPLFTVLSAKGDVSPRIVHDQMEHGIQEHRHARLVAFVDRVASVLGWSEVVIGSMSLDLQATDMANETGITDLKQVNRVWILIEVLCSWCWPGGKAMDSAIPFLESCAACASGSIGQFILDSVVNSLFSAALTRSYDSGFSNKFWMGLDEDMDDVEDPFLHALLVLLKNLLRMDPPCGTANNVDRFFEMLILNGGFLEDSLLCKNSVILPYILRILVPFLRKRQKSSNESILDTPSGITKYLSLEVVVCKWIGLALCAPPLSSCGGSNSDVEHLVWVAVSCFPLHPGGGSVTILATSSACATTKERSLLLALMQKQASREAVAGYHAHAAQQRVSAPQNHPEESNWSQSYQGTLAKLVAATVAYCWQDFEPEDWAFVMSHMSEWLEAAVVEAEDFTELVASVIKEADTRMGKELQVSMFAAKIGIEVVRVKSRQSELTWTAVVIFSLISAVETSSYLNSSVSVAQLQSSNWERVKLRAVKDILRLFFASGLAEAVAMDSDADDNACAIIPVSRVANIHLWENISEIVLGVSDQEKTEAAYSVDLWDVGKGAVRALYALLFSRHPIGEVQLAAYCLLSSASVQQAVVTHEEAGLQQDQSEEEPLSMGIEGPPLSHLTKIRYELAVVLETAPVDILESSHPSPLRVRYFLAWAIFLSHLHSVSVSSAAGERLVQYAQESNISFTLLDSLFQHIPLKSGSSSHGRRKKIIGPQQSETVKIEAAARRAAASGSVSFAVEGLWPLEEDTVSILAGALYGLALQVFPACARVWFTGLRDRSTASAVEVFTTNYCSPELLAEEFLKVQKAAISDESLIVKANQKAGEITVVYKKEEAGMDMVIRLSKCYPLRAVDVDCTRRLGISETRLRKWMLSMQAFLRNQNGAVAEAIQIWKRNVDREFEGVEECPICYSIIHTVNRSLPRLACKTCRHKFHAACLYKWFSTSHKSTCPLCQTPF